MNDLEVLSQIRSFVQMEAEALLQVPQKMDIRFAQVVSFILNARGRVVISGVGKSGLVGRKMSSTFSSTGTRSVFLHPTDALHGDLGGLDSSDVLILISKSGETRELLDLLHSVKGIGLRTVAFVSDEKSTLSKLCDLAMVFYHEKEACPYNLAPTTSTTTTMAIGDAMALTVMKLRDFQPRDFALFHPGGKLGQRLHLKVRDIMIPREQFKTLGHLKVKLSEVISAIGTLGLVVFSDSANKILGILTDGDLRRALEKHGENFHSLNVASLVNSKPLTIAANKTAFEALEFMEKRERPLNVIPVVEPETGELAGILRLHELVKIF